MNNRPYKVYRIEDGIVIDHIPNKKSLDVLKILGLDKEHDSLITLGVNLSSSKFGKKDVIKIENKILSEDELNKIAIVSPEATINIIKNGKLINKHNAVIPEKYTGIIKCPNPLCVTRVEKVNTIFYSETREKKVKCHYCERKFEVKYVNLL
ncbi:MAG: aspartate carbamoyltransferase regulatory subunit [Candidatus Muiribacteriota bacterium]